MPLKPQNWENWNYLCNFSSRNADPNQTSDMCEVSVDMSWGQNDENERILRVKFHIFIFNHIIFKESQSSTTCTYSYECKNIFKNLERLKRVYWIHFMVTCGLAWDLFSSPLCFSPFFIFSAILTTLTSVVVLQQRSKMLA